MSAQPYEKLEYDPTHDYVKEYADKQREKQTHLVASNSRLVAASTNFQAKTNQDSRLLLKNVSALEETED